MFDDDGAWFSKNEQHFISVGKTVSFLLVFFYLVGVGVVAQCRRLVSAEAEGKVAPQRLRPLLKADHFRGDHCSRIGVQFCRVDHERFDGTGVAFEGDLKRYRRPSACETVSSKELNGNLRY